MGAVYAEWRGCVYAAGAYMHPGVYTRVGAYTRTVGVYTQGVCIRTPSRIHRFLRIRTPDCAGYAGIDEPLMSGPTPRRRYYFRYVLIENTSD